MSEDEKQHAKEPANDPGEKPADVSEEDSAAATAESEAADGIEKTPPSLADIILELTAALAEAKDHSLRQMAESENTYRAAYFQFALDDPAPAARRLERIVDWRCRIAGLPYGDQGLLISRTFYDHLGGFRRMPLMEDVDMARRIGKSRLMPLAAQAVTSAERYRRHGYLLRPALNLVCLGMYLLGLPLSMIQGIYKFYS